MDKIKEVQDRLERGYTMAIYGNSGGIHEQMTRDIKILLEALTLGVVVGQSEQLQAIEDLKEFARNNCREWNTDQMEEIIDRL